MTRGCFVVATGLALGVGCGGEGDEGSNSSATTGSETSSPGQVTDPFDTYCVATFEREHVVTDSFEERAFTARPGARYLMSRYESFGRNVAELLYLTPDGPWSFTVEAEEGGTFPFRSNCEPGDNTEYYAAFTDVVVHGSAELSAELCSLELGTAVVRDGTVPTGYALTGFSLGGPQVYEVRLNAFSAECGGAESGFVSVPETQLFDSTTYLVPIQPLIGPS